VEDLLLVLVLVLVDGAELLLVVAAGKLPSRIRRPAGLLERCISSSGCCANESAGSKTATEAIEKINLRIVHSKEKPKVALGFFH